MQCQILTGDCSAVLGTLPEASVHCCVTSPPYWGLRDYGHDRQIGLEETPEEYVKRLVEVFARVWRVLRADGTLWLNLGDSYASDVKGSGGSGKSRLGPNGDLQNIEFQKMEPKRFNHGLMPKNLVGIPWRVAFALQASGWYLRSDIIWHKPNPMPESVTDRPTKAHEYIFLLSKSERYYYDGEAINEPATSKFGFGITNGSQKYGDEIDLARPHSGWMGGNGENRNKRSVWTVPTSPFPEAHFATYPPDLIKPCILAGCPAGGTVLDPFGGSGTTGMVALELGRKAILIELNPEYVKLAEQRCNVTPGLQLM